MKTRMMDYPTNHHDGALYDHAISISDALMNAAQHGDQPEHNLMRMAADYIRVLESVIELLKARQSGVTPDECSSPTEGKEVTKDWLSQQDDPGIAQRVIELIGLN